jgi:hypothetical protein
VINQGFGVCQIESKTAERDRPQLLLNHPQGNRHQARLLDFAPVGVSIETEVTNCDLALVGNMGSRPGDELQIVHSLHLFGVFPTAVADLPLLLIEGEVFQGQKRANHVFKSILTAATPAADSPGSAVLAAGRNICRRFPVRRVASVPPAMPSGWSSGANG